VERDKLFVEFDWTSEVDDITGGESRVFRWESVVYGIPSAVLCVSVRLVVAVRRATAQHLMVAW
jgi:hypothetical protein